MKSKNILWKHPLPKIKYFFRGTVMYIQYDFYILFDTYQAQICSASYTAKQTVQK